MHPRTTVLLTLGVLAIASTGFSAPPGPPTTRAITLTVEPIACASEPDGVCLGYNGQIPGPMIDVNLGDTLQITLVNNYSRPVSWHVHGTVLAANMDGIAAHPGTNLIESVAPPGGSFTYTVRVGYAGTWHYHDHVLGPDGAEGVHRGLYGGLIVRNGAEARPGAVFDLHMVDAGANGGRGLYATTNATSFDVLLAGLGNVLWPISIRSPSNTMLDSVTIGPGMSDRFHVENAVPGVYTLRAPGPVGTITVVPP